MEVKGKIIQVLPLQQGTSKSGNPWKKQEYVLETFDNFPRKVKFDFFGDRADQYPLALGDEVTVSFDIESREFNGRWYTDIRGWKAEKGTAAPAPAAPAADPFGGQTAQPFAGVEPFGAPQGDQSDDLPF